MFFLTSAHADGHQTTPVRTTHSNHDSTVPLMTFRKFQGHDSVIVTTHMDTNSLCQCVLMILFLMLSASTIMVMSNDLSLSNLSLDV